MANFVHHQISSKMKTTQDTIESLKTQKIELSSQIADLQKARISLTETVDQENAGYWQVCDVSAKLCESSQVAKKKVDDALDKLKSVQECNKWCSNKIQSYDSRHNEEMKLLVQKISEWGKRMSDLTVQFQDNAALFNGDIEKDLECKKQERNALICEQQQLEQKCSTTQAETQRLEKLEEDENEVNFLKNKEADFVIKLADNVIEQQSMEEIFVLRKEKQELEKWISSAHSKVFDTQPF